MTDVAIRVTQVGWMATLTDLGRHDAEIRGVPSGGAADQHSAAVANILVGNRRDAVLIETIGDFGFVAPTSMLVAVTGTPAEVAIDGAPAAQWDTLVLRTGQELTVGEARGGLRSYIAIGGELQAPRFLGSAAPDPRMGFKQGIDAGQQLVVRRPSVIAKFCAADKHCFDFDAPRLDFSDGPWFLHVVRAAEAESIPDIEELLSEAVYTVKPQSDHVGVRLAGPVRHPQGPEIVSHGVPIGAIEIPHADDELIVLGRYRTLTAGYPVVGVVAKTDLSLVGQLACNRSVRFRWIDRTQAVARAAQQESALAALEHAVNQAFGCLVDQILTKLFSTESDRGASCWP